MSNIVICNNHRLLMLEGIPGSGKTTTAQLLHKHYSSLGITTTLFIEGSEHPIDLPFYAYVTPSEFEYLLKEYPQQREWLCSHAIIETEYRLIPYKAPQPIPKNNQLVHYLANKEFCYSEKAMVSFNQFKKVFIKRFEQFVASAMDNEAVYILESVLLQHQLHDIHRLYPEVTDDEIIQYISELSRILNVLNPMLFYLSQDSVEQSLNYIANIRSKPKWASSDTITYYIKRKDIELRAMKSMPMKSMMINNTDRNWNKMMNLIIGSIHN